MKNKAIYILLMLAVVFTTACSDDESIEDNTLFTSSDVWEETSGVYRGKMMSVIEGVAVDTFYQQAQIYSDDRKKMNLKINSLIVDEDINLREVFFRDLHLKREGGTVKLWGETVQNTGPINNAVLALNGSIRNNSMELEIRISSNTAKTIYLKFDSEKLEELLSDDPTILKMKLEHPLIVSPPDITGNRITFFVTDTLHITDTTDLYLKPEFELVEGATISYPDSVMNFFNTRNRPKYTVWAEDSIHRRTYTVFFSQASILKYDFNRWENIGEWSEPIGNWATNNGYFKKMRDEGEYSGPYPVTRVKGYKVADFGAHMKTVLVGNNEEQRIVGGSFFQGRFDTQMLDTLNGVVYGAPFNGRPEKVKGYYKYIPGSMVIKKDTLISSPLKNDTIISDTLTLTDRCLLQAILYEADNPDATLDSLNYLNDPKVVAIAQMDPNRANLMQTEFTEFNIYFEYIRGYFVTKRYKIAFISSPTSHSDKYLKTPSVEYWSWPQSELTVSNIEVMYRKNK